MNRHVAILREYARIGVFRKAQLRVEFVSQIVMDCFWYATKIGIFETLFQYTKRIAGWSAPDIRVLLGVVFVADAFMMMWLRQRWKLGRELKDGKLDPLRIRPASSVIVYFFQQFSLEAAFNMAVAFGYLLFGLARHGLLSQPREWLLLPWAVALAWWSMVVVAVFFALPEFFMTNSDAGNVLQQVFDTASVNPLDVFSSRIRMLLLYFVPVGLVNYVPASILLGRLSVLESLGFTAFMVAFGLLTFRAWRWSFRRYESAMG